MEISQAKGEWEVPTITNEMNETDVREAIVRPLLVRLGYGFGKFANIRTEVPLRYNQAFLGRKNPDKDLALQGRADYICEVISYGRWVVEAKKASEDLTIEDSFQAYTYAAHPEIAALYYVLTNGRAFQVYRIGHPETPMLTFSYEDLESRFVEIRNILSPKAIKQHYQRNSFPEGKPLAEGLGPHVRVLGGHNTYVENICSKPELQKAIAGSTDGMRASILSGEVKRDGSGMVCGTLEFASSNSAMDMVNRAMGAGSFVYETADEFISIDKEKPSIFQNLATFKMNEGLEIPAMIGIPPSVMPVELECSAFTQAVGYYDYEDQKIKGVFNIDYNFTATGTPKNFQARAIANLLHGLRLRSAGDFEVILSRK